MFVVCFHSDKTSKQQCPMLNFVLPFSLLEDPLTEYMYSGGEEWSLSEAKNIHDLNFHNSCHVTEVNCKY